MAKLERVAEGRGKVEALDESKRVSKRANLHAVYMAWLLNYF